MPSLGLEELPIDPSPGDIFLGLDLTGADYYQKALLHLKKQGLKVTFVVYDLLPLQLPQHFADNSVASFRNWLQMVCNFDGVFAISDSVRKDLISYINTNQINICPDFFVSKIPLGLNFEVTPKGTQPEVLNKEDISEHFVGDVNFLMVGTLEPRKGHTLVLEAFEALWAKGIEVNLIIVGKKGWLVDNLVYRLETHPEFGRKLHWLNFVSDAELESCYELAQCLIFASEGEGFGLPIIEASKRGLPLLLRDIPIFREVAGQSATYFPSRGFEELAFEIEDWLNKYYSHALPDPEDLPVSTWSSSAETFMMEIRRLLF